MLEKWVIAPKRFVSDLWYSMSEIEEYTHLDLIRSCDTILRGFINKYGMNFFGVRPDGFTVDLEKDVIKYSITDFAHISLMRGVEFGL